MSLNVGSRSCVRFFKDAVGMFNGARLPIERASSPPATWYTDQFRAFDDLSVLQNSWVAVGNISQVGHSGSYFTARVGSTNVIVLRDTDDVLRAFVNRCAHRGMKLLDEAEESGSLTCLRCPYHGWTYNLQGKLSRAPRMKGTREFNSTDNSLTPVSVDTLGLTCFVRLDNRELSIPRDAYRNLTDNIRSLNSPDDYKFVRRVIHEVPFDWKLGFENAIDFTHIDHVHHDFSANLSSTYNLQCDDTPNYSFQTSFPKPDSEVFGSEPIQYVVMFPNCVFNRFGPWVDNSYWLPKPGGGSVVIFDYFLLHEYINSKSPDAIKDEIEKNVGRSSSVQDEDTWICERLQEGMKSGFNGGRYSPSSDIATYNYHLFLHKCYSEASRELVEDID